jgi:CubicO group peptidase (beta-lactamase class C family)
MKTELPPTIDETKSRLRGVPDRPELWEAIQGENAKPPRNGRFRIGSTTKTFVATLVLQLVAVGKIGLDTPAAGYLPRLSLDRAAEPRAGNGLELRHQLRAGQAADRDGHRPLERRGDAASDPAAAGLRGTVVPGTRRGIPESHARGYYRYEDAGQWKVVDTTRMNPSWISSASEMISTTGDLSTFFSALMGGQLLPDPLLAEMREPHLAPLPNSGWGALMYGTLDGSTTLTASLTSGDAAIDPADAFNKAKQRLVDEAFCAGRAGATEEPGR